jgi:3-hydroxyisobutyrate dehydrogenase-like beta-hydroxyacid dehydrogenase
MSNIGFLGFGMMGSIIYGKVDSRFPVRYVYNRTREKVVGHITRNTEIADNPETVFKNCDTLFLSLTDSKAVESILLHDNSASDYIREGSIVIDLSTVSLKTSLKVAEALAKRNISYLDCPVIGSTKAALSSSLVTVAGGSEESFKSIEPMLKTFSKKVYYVGPSGNGTKVKLINNLVMGTNMAILAEAVAISKKLGLNDLILLEILQGGGAGSKILDLKKEKLIAKDYSPEFKLAHQLKDLKYFLEVSSDKNFPSLIGSVVTQLFSAAFRMNLGESDMSAIAEFNEKIE